MKILISGYKVPSIAESIAHEFKSRGFSVRTFLLDDKRHWVDRFILKRLNSMLKAICRRGKDFSFLIQTYFNQERWYQRRFARQFYEFEPDVVFVIQGKPIFSIQPFRNIGVKFFGWWIEPSDAESEILRNSREFDFYYSYSMKTLEILQANNIQCAYLSHGYSTRIFGPLSKRTIEYDLVFVGNWSPWRDQVLREVFKVTSRIRIYGPRWLSRSSIDKFLLRKVYGGDHIDEKFLNDFYNSAKIVLNASRVKMSSGLNLRFFEVLGAGALLLTDQVPELPLHFGSDTDLVVFGSLPELREKLEHFLGNNQKSTELALKGHARVLKHHTYAKLTNTLEIKFRESLNGHRI